MLIRGLGYAVGVHRVRGVNIIFLKTPGVPRKGLKTLKLPQFISITNYIPFIVIFTITGPITFPVAPPFSMVNC